MMNSCVWVTVCQTGGCSRRVLLVPDAYVWRGIVSARLLGWEQSQLCVSNTPPTVIYIYMP